MKTLRRIEVEPLGEQRWEKIERSLLARVERGFVDAGHLPQPGRRWTHSALLVAAMLVSVLGLALLVTRQQPQHAALEDPSRISTGPNASHLALPGLSLDVEPHSAVVVGAETSQGLLIVLDQGTIVCQVAPRATDRPLIVQAGAARVRVLGTRFSVTRLGEAARVQVEHGVVEVLSSGGRWRVEAGQDWPPAAPAPSATRSPVASPGPSVEARPLSTGARPASAEAPPGRTVTRLRPTPTSATPTPAAPATASASVEEARPVPDAVPRPVPSRQDVFEQATLLERSDPARAAHLYGSLESGGDSWAQNALYARGRLEASRGNRPAARRLLAQYLERFPQGTNAQDARAVLERLR
jgi:hypothetical protein